jgi:hypothetical protein
MIVEPQNVYGDKDLTTGREVHTTPRPEREPFFRADIEAQRPSPEEQQQTSRKFEHVNNRLKGEAVPYRRRPPQRTNFPPDPKTYEQAMALVVHQGRQCSENSPRLVMLAGVAC